MDISGLSMAMNQGKLADAASIAVMKIAMDTGKEKAINMTQMLEKVSDPNLGHNIDVKG